MISRITGLVTAPLATVEAAQRVADDLAAVAEAVVGLARSLPKQLSAITLRLGEIQTDVAALPAITREIAALQERIGEVAARLAKVEAGTEPLSAQLAQVEAGTQPLSGQLEALQRSVDSLAGTVDSAVALLPDPDDSPGLIARARDALATDGGS